MKLEKVLIAVGHNIGYVEDVSYEYLGEAKSWEFNDINGDFSGIILSSGADVIVLELYGINHTYQWIAPKKRVPYLAENLSVDTLVEDEDDMLDKVRSIVELKPFDQRWLTPVTMTDEEFMKIAKMAHANDITFNEQVNKIVKQMAKLANYNQPLPVFGEKNATHTIV